MAAVDSLDNHLLLLQCGRGWQVGAQNTRQILRAAFNVSNEPLPSAPRTLVVVKRPNNHPRHIDNHDEIVKALTQTFGPQSKYKLDVVVFDSDALPAGKTAYADAADKFSRALIIFAPHGAGLSNILFAPQDALVLELLEQSGDLNLCYFNLAGHLRMAYRVS